MLELILLKWNDKEGLKFLPQVKAIHESAVKRFSEKLNVIQNDYPEFWSKVGLKTPARYKTLYGMLLRFSRVKKAGWVAATTQFGILLRPDILEKMTPEGMEVIYLHELAHVIQDRLWPDSDGHGLEWEIVCRLLELKEISEYIDLEEYSVQGKLAS